MRENRLGAIPTALRKGDELQEFYGSFRDMHVALRAKVEEDVRVLGDAGSDGILTRARIAAAVQIFLAIPSELADAARVDGANPWQIFRSVYVPLARPALATLAIFQFMWSWNDLLDPLIYLRDLPSYTTTVGLAFFQGQYSTNTALMGAAAVLVALPVVIVYLVLQRYFISGMVDGAVKD